jgi:hypothetical protein
MHGNMNVKFTTPNSLIKTIESNLPTEYIHH